MAPNILSFGNKLLIGNNASEIFNDSRLPGDGLPEFQNKGLPVEHDPKLRVNTAISRKQPNPTLL